MGRIDTRLAILKAALEMFSERGYSSSTTKEISAKAGVSEMTLFRHFPTKLGLLESVFASFVFNPSFEKLESKLSGDLEADLSLIARGMVEVMSKNIQLFAMNIRDIPRGTEFRDTLSRFPNELLRILRGHLEALGQEGKFKGDPESYAISFLTSTWGTTLNFLIFRTFNTTVELDTCLRIIVRLFAQGATQNDVSDTHKGGPHEKST